VILWFSRNFGQQAALTAALEHALVVIARPRLLYPSSVRSTPCLGKALRIALRRVLPR